MITENTPAPKRSYAKREKRSPTMAYYNEQIAKKEQEIEKAKAEIINLTEKRNGLFFDESAMIGLIDLMADPEKAKWLAEKVGAYDENKL